MYFFPGSFLIFIAQVALPSAALGLLGDSPAKCDAAYGTPVLCLVASGYEFRSYKLTDCRIRVVFAHDKSAVEQLTLHPKTAEAAMLFLQSLLSTKYGFIDAELAQLTNVTPTGGDHMTSAATHGALRVACTLDVGSQPLRFTAMIAQARPAEETQHIHALLLEGSRQEREDQSL